MFPPALPPKNTLGLGNGKILNRSLANSTDLPLSSIAETVINASFPLPPGALAM
jgi:hypothetical protein